jgi:hypothetical protein
VSDPNELKPLDVAARLCAAMVEDGQTTVATATRKTVPYLLLMIERRAPINRAVLRYLGLRRVAPDRDRYVSDARLETIRPRYLAHQKHVAP